MKLSLVLVFCTTLAAAKPLGARQDTSSKKPFLHPDRRPAPTNCGAWQLIDPPERRSEACAGTIQYCREGFFRDFGEDFTNEEDCLKSRNPEPGAAPPVVEPKKQFLPPPTQPCVTFGRMSVEEKCVGTEQWCNDEEWNNFGDESFKDAEECKRSREKIGEKIEGDVDKGRPKWQL